MEVLHGGFVNHLPRSGHLNTIAEGFPRVNNMIKISSKFLLTSQLRIALVKGQTHLVTSHSKETVQGSQLDWMLEPRPLEHSVERFGKVIVFKQLLEIFAFGLGQPSPPTFLTDDVVFTMIFPNLPKDIAV